jgi:putative flippase GtrA
MLTKGNSILHEIKKMTLYAGNGIINTIVCYGLFLIMSNFIDYRVAIVLVYIPGIFLSYFLNGKIVFKNRGYLPIFIIIAVFMMGLNVVTTWLLVEVFHTSKQVSMLIAIGLVFVIGYLLNKRYSFQKSTIKTTRLRI